MVVVVNRDSASNEPKVVYKSNISKLLLLHIYNTFVVSCLSAFSDLGLATDPCTACPSLSLLRSSFLPLPRMWNTFCWPGIFTREFVGKRGDGGNCRGGVMRGSRLSRPLTSNASKFLLLLGISPLLHFPFLLDFVWAVCASSVLWRV